MSQKRDYYEVLGVSKNASLQEIKRAYRQLAKKYHPDVSQEANAQAKFKEVNEAYQVLSNQEARQKYDQYGHAAFSGAQGQEFKTFFQDFNFEDIFSGFSSFFDRRSDSQARRQQNNHFRLKLTFQEAMHGVRKTVDYPFEAGCSACKATGAASHHDLTRCHTCNGRGYEMRRTTSLFGLFEQKAVCRTCQGRKELIKQKCSTCRGKQFVKTMIELEITVPKGVASEQQLRFTRKGTFDALRRTNHDLFVELVVERSPLYRRENLDLFIKVPVSYLDSLLGAKILVPTIDGEKVITLDKGVTSGKIYRLRRFGAYDPVNQRTRGDLFVEIVVNFPTRTPGWLKPLLSSIAKQNEFDPNGEFIADLKRKKLL